MWVTERNGSVLAAGGLPRLHFSSGGKSAGTQTVQQVAEPWGPSRQHFIDIFNLAKGYHETPMQFFPGQTFAGFSPETGAALQMQANRALMGSPLNNLAQSEIGRTLGGSYLGAGNPYFEPMLERVYGQLRPKLDTQFAGIGRYGSGAHEQAMASALSDTAGQLLYDDYGRERAMMAEAAKFAPQLADQDYADFGKLAEVGGVYEDLQQQMINEEMARHQFDQMEPWQRLELYRGFIDGGLGGTSTQTTTGTTPRRNLAGSALGGAASGAAAGAGAGPWGAVAGGILGGLAGLFG